MHNFIFVSQEQYENQKTFGVSARTFDLLIDIGVGMKLHIIDEFFVESPPHWRGK